MNVPLPLVVQLTKALFPTGLLFGAKLYPEGIVNCPVVAHTSVEVDVPTVIELVGGVLRVASPTTGVPEHV